MIGPHELKGQPNLAEVLEAAIPLAEMGRTYTLLRNRGKHDLLRKEIAARSIQTNLLDYVCYLDQIVTEQYKNLPIHSSMSLSDIVRVCGLDIPQPNQISSAHNAQTMTAIMIKILSSATDIKLPLNHQGAEMEVPLLQVVVYQQPIYNPYQQYWQQQPFYYQQPYYYPPTKNNQNEFYARNRNSHKPYSYNDDFVSLKYQQNQWSMEEHNPSYLQSPLQMSLDQQTPPLSQILNDSRPQQGDQSILQPQLPLPPPAVKTEVPVKQQDSQDTSYGAKSIKPPQPQSLKPRFIPSHHTIFEQDAEEEEKVESTWNESGALQHTHILILDTNQPKSQYLERYDLIQLNAYLYNIDNKSTEFEVHFCLHSQSKDAMPHSVYRLNGLEQVYTAPNKCTLVQAINSLFSRLAAYDPKKIITATFNLKTYKTHLLAECHAKNIELPPYLYQTIEIAYEWRRHFQTSQYHEILAAVGSKNSNYFDSYLTTQVNLDIIKYMQNQGFKWNTAEIKNCFGSQKHRDPLRARRGEYLKEY